MDEKLLETSVRKVKTFTEKPNQELALNFLDSGDFLWNSGIFIWNAEKIIKSFKKHLPDMQKHHFRFLKHLRHSPYQPFPSKMKFLRSPLSLVIQREKN